MRVQKVRGVLQVPGAKTADRVADGLCDGHDGAKREREKVGRATGEKVFARLAGATVLSRGAVTVEGAATVGLNGCHLGGGIAVGSLIGLTG